ncbi:hypothetical protein RO3G_16836 [Lichtheimia corymbifera JMRC:FSU:9682]|uniref:Arrestin C-terminal-like domain-containing protein n=1 Tax=Lichtheimia corymbifera JMRC:FSU:9682 TaxID=1263082 RepID=A0A068RVA1_9FUNG|nr:hypothetical protein RO3G_16836 [Lichtheimia corymbifera JMRC:FSU:9682]
MRHLTKGSTTIDIRLNEEKFYFPGELIKGVVVVHPKHPTKTNHIRLTFSGEVHISVKDKETFNLFQKTEILPVSTHGKAQVLEAKQHTFPFEFAVPDDLPSTMEFGKRKTYIRYRLTAIHDRPMVPESLCAKADYTVPILELVDVDLPRYTKPQEQTMDFVPPKSKPGQQCQLKTSIPRFGYTRGDLVKPTILLNHYERFVRKGAIKVDLVRIVDIKTSRNTLTKEDVLKSMEHDANIIGPYNFSQAFHPQLLIPTSTPPTVKYKEKIIEVQYRIRIRLYMTGKKTAHETQLVEMPIVIGTWPKATLPIDDDDDYDSQEGPMLSDEESDEEDDQKSVLSIPPPPQPTQSRSSTFATPQQAHRRTPSISLQSTPSASTITLTLQNTHIGNSNGVVRSDSNASRSSNRSRGSVASWRSSQSWDRSPTLSRNTSACTNITNPETSMYNGRNLVVSAGSQTYINRTPSTPEFGSAINNMATAPPPPQPYYYDSSSYMQQQHQAYQYQQQQQQQRYDYAGMSNSSVPTHVLQPLSTNNTVVAASSSTSSSASPRSPISPSTTTTTTNKMPHRNYNYDFYDDSEPASTFSPPRPTTHSSYQPSTLSSDDSDDSDDEGDLLRIIEKKKKQAERERRANMYKY